MTEKSYPIMDPVTRMPVAGIRRKYILKMKQGAGTLANPHRPEIADFLENIAGDWWVDRAEGTIQIACPESTHDKLIQPPQDEEGVLLFKPLALYRG